MFKRLLFSVKFFLTKIIYYIYCVGKPIEKKIVFQSFGGKQYSDNPRAISEKMRELFPEYKIVWYIKDSSKIDNFIPSYVKKVDRKVLFYKELSTAFCYVTNTENGPNIIKRRNQYFIQTWHADRAIKKVLYDADDLSGLFFKIIDNEITDLCISGSELGTRVYRSAFRYNGKILEEGMPRNDKLVINDENEINNIKRKFGFSYSDHILLYAPSFRDKTRSKQDINVDLIRVKEILEKNGEQWKVLVRAHSASNGLLLSEKNKGDYIDVTTYPDMTDLLLISDLLITDYSSSSGDFVLRNKMVVLAMFDYKSYTENCRGLVFDPEQAGFYVAYDQARLEEIIENRAELDIRLNCETIKKEFKINETGRSSEKICCIISDEYKKRVKH